MNQESEEFKQLQPSARPENDELKANLPEAIQPGVVVPQVENVPEVDESVTVKGQLDQRPASRKRVGIFCFNCNRREGHFLHRENRWYYSYLIGLTFGLIKIIGPLQCQCCGARRLMWR